MTIENDLINDRVRDMIAAGATFARVAKALRLSRSAVAGRCHRMGIKTVPKSSAPAPIKKPVMARRRITIKSARPLAHDLSPPSPATAIAVIANAGGCRWPLYEEGNDLRLEELLECGGPVAAHSYCGHHCAIAFRPERAA